MARESYTGPVSSYAGKATGKLAAADAKVREAKAGQRDAEARADAADRRAERLEAALERIGERLDAIERRLDRKAPTVPKAEVRAVEARIDGSGGALVYGLRPSARSSESTRDRRSTCARRTRSRTSTWGG